LDPSSFSSGNKDEIIIEEKRRRSKGQEGYTIHRYRRGKMLGKGGFAKVYMCTALDSGKDYAVKIVPKANLVKARARQKLQAEIKIHRTLKHKHVCEYKHFFEDKTNCYILLELCHNQSMNEMIKRRKRLTEPEAAFFMQDMIGAVKYMHENFVIHRDLKLGNLFLDKNMHIKVGDLGLATRLEKAEEKRKTICGTPNYIAPEVIQGTKETRGHSYEVDIWSMGVILYTMLIGKPPYEAKDVKATYKRIIANEYDFPVHTPISPQARDLIAAMLQSRPEQRPTLDEISQHAFFNDGVQIPLFLPSSATQIAPTWMHDEIGQLVPRPIESEENDSNSSKNDSSTATLPSMARGGSVRRLPLKNKDPNINNYGSDEYKKPVQLNDWFNPPPGMVQSAVAAASVKQSTAGALQFERRNKPEIQPAFRVFDETGASSKRSSSGRMDGLVSQTSNLRLNDDAERAPVEKPLPVDSDAEVLLLMLERLTTVLEVSKQSEFMYAASQVKEASRGAPIKWITRYVDYTSKYGLGFLMNDGSSGVYFNDSTKAILQAQGDAFQYVERKKLLNADTRSAEPLCKIHSLDAYPDELHKKVTLLKHFRNYLLEQQKKSDEDDFTTTSSVDISFVYLKKWVRTKHAILFRLSDQTVQIVFYDQTEVLLTPDERFVTYVDKKRNRCTYYLNDELVATNAELAKRLKYSKEILQQLISGQKR
jgi:polo-like kinase 1